MSEHHTWSEQDARLIMDVLSKRFARFGLAVHPEKTKLVRFGRPSKDDQSKHNETFDFLGFTHFWSKSRRGNWIIKKKTMGKRVSRFVKAIWQWVTNPCTSNIWLFAPNYVGTTSIMECATTTKP